MGRNVYGVYSLPDGYLAETGETIEASQHNTPLEDIESDMNTARPIVAGGTGANSASGARENLGANDASNLTEGTLADARLSFTVSAFSKTLLDDTTAAAWKTTLDALGPAEIHAATAKTTPVNDDELVIVDSAASWVAKRVGLDDLKTFMLSSPALTGSPTAPTPTAGDSDTSVATTAFVTSAIAARDWTYLADEGTPSGTSTADMTIGAGATEIEILFFGPSLAAGSGHIVVRIGPTGGVESTGYVSSSASISPGATAVISGTSGFVIYNATAGGTIYGIMKLSRSTINSSAWVASHSCYRDSGNVSVGGGAKTITGTIGKLVVAVSGDTFDGGSVSVRWR